MFKRASTAIVFTIFWIATSAVAEDTVAFGVSRPPYVMQDRETGIAVELFKHIYAKLGRTYQPKYVSNARMEHSLSAGAVDVAVEVKKTSQDLFYSKPFVTYRNFIITRADDNANIKTFADLSGKAVCTWQQANEHLGRPFQEAMNSFSYNEFANQNAQVRVFLGGRCDAIIIDEHIFKYWVDILQNDSSFQSHIVSTNFTYQPVPGQSDNTFFVGFKNRELRDQFDRELATLKASGEYERIVNWKDWSKPPS